MLRVKKRSVALIISFTIENGELKMKNDPFRILCVGRS